MSADYSIFIKTSDSLAEIRACFENASNCTMNQAPNDDNEFYYVKLLGLGVNLYGDLTYEGELIYQDSKLPLSQYNYAISIDYIPSSYIRDYRDEWTEMFSTITADIISMNLHCECIVVRNMQTVLTRFTPGEQIFIQHT
jgi:hypothetical protein